MMMLLFRVLNERFVVLLEATVFIITSYSVNCMVFLGNFITWYSFAGIANWVNENWNRTEIDEPMGTARNEWIGRDLLNPFSSWANSRMCANRCEMDPTSSRQSKNGRNKNK